MVKVKASKAVSVIGGADGPTAIFVAGKNKKNIRLQLKKFIRQQKKKRIEKEIVACPHTMDEVVSYVKQKYGYVEVNKSDDEYQNEYRQIRASFILQYNPKLLGEYGEVPVLKEHTEEAIKEFYMKLEKRQQVAENIASFQYDIDLHMLKFEKNDFESILCFESIFDYIGGSASGNKKNMQQFNKIYADVYRYFGVEQSDIDNKTRRYKSLVSVLLG